MAAERIEIWGSPASGRAAVGSRFATTETKEKLLQSGDVRNGRPVGGGDCWRVDVTKSHNVFFLHNFQTLQLYAGGMSLLPTTTTESFASCKVSVLDFVGGSYCNEFGYGFFSVDVSDDCSPAISSITFRCGPFSTRSEYRMIDAGKRADFCVADLTVYPSTQQQGNGHNNNNNIMTVLVEQVDLKLPAMLPYLERIGISKERATLRDVEGERNFKKWARWVLQTCEESGDTHNVNYYGCRILLERGLLEES